MLPNVTRQHAAAANGLLNTCSRDVLLELLRFLKRAYWPFSWDSSSGAHHATVAPLAVCGWKALNPTNGSCLVLDLQFGRCQHPGQWLLMLTCWLQS